VSQHEATHVLPPDAASIVLARRAVEALPLGRGRTGEVKLIVSELVTNSIEHAELGAGDRIEVLARVESTGALHMEVRDPGPGPPPNARHGIGWRILERMADRWGVDRAEGLARVWFELDA
jgi:two-component sensor histidine kinase